MSIEKIRIQEFPQMDLLPVDMEHPNRVLLSGLYCENIKIEEKERVFYTYLAPELENDNQCVVVAIPSTAEIPEYLESSGLRAFADEKKIFLFLVAPKIHKWDFSGSDADFMNAVYVNIQNRDYYVTMQDNIYAFGIGDGATIAMQAAMKMSSEWSGVGTFGNFLPSVMMDTTKKINGNETGVELHIESVKSQLPVWVALDNETVESKAVIDYWKTQNKCLEEPFSGQGADIIYTPSPVRMRDEVNQEQIAQVRVTFAAEYSPELLAAMWNYLGKARRHRGFNGKFLRYYKSPLDCGATYHTLAVDGMVREWFEYVPECLQGTTKPVPLVVTLHGRGGTGETFFDISGMSCVAEERGFIAVFPTAGIYQQKANGLRNITLWEGSYEGKYIDDIHFIREMITDVKKRNEIDESRIYACGQSSGGMMASRLAEVANDIFVAISPWSGLFTPSKEYTVPPRLGHHVPYLFLYGEKDWLCVSSSANTLPFCVNDNISAYLGNLIKEYRLAPEPLMYVCGEITFYEYQNSQHTPMLIVGKVCNMPHANYPRESWIAYDQYFSKFARAKDGTLLYMGHAAE